MSKFIMNRLIPGIVVVCLVLIAMTGLIFGISMLTEGGNWQERLKESFFVVAGVMGCIGGAICLGGLWAWATNKLEK